MPSAGGGMSPGGRTPPGPPPPPARIGESRGGDEHLLGGEYPPGPSAPRGHPSVSRQSENARTVAVLAELGLAGCAAGTRGKAADQASRVGLDEDALTLARPARAVGRLDD